MSSLVVSANAVLPMFLIIALGIALRRFSLIEEKVASALNNLVFLVLLPTLIFNNIRNADIYAVLHPRFIVFSVASCFGVWGLATLIAKLTLSDPLQKGAFIQGMARSNFVLFGLPMYINLYGTGQAGLISFMVGVVTPVFNLLAILTLETYRHSAVKPSQVGRGIITNPLIIASAAGVVFMLLRIPLPEFLNIALANLGGATTPIALLVLGSLLTPAGIKGRLLPLSVAVTGKLIIIPAIVLPAAIAIGFRGHDLATLVAIFASPTAVASFVMARKLESDGELAAEIVVFSTLFSGVTVFLWVFVMHFNGLLVI